MIHVITLGFAPARVIQRGMERFYATYDSIFPIKHYLIDQHYPLHREENLAQMKLIAEEYSLIFLDSGFDRGFHNGLNWVLEQIKPESGDVIITYDPDGGPVEKDWLLAMNHVIKRGGYSVVCLADHRSLKELSQRGYTSTFVDGVKVLEPKVNTVFSIVAWDWDFMKSILPIYEENPYYGGLEAYVWSKTHQWAYLPEYTEELSGRDLADPEFNSWKWEHAQFKSFPGSFAEFLAAGCPITKPMIGPP